MEYVFVIFSHSCSSCNVVRLFQSYLKNAFELFSRSACVCMCVELLKFSYLMFSMRYEAIVMNS